MHSFCLGSGYKDGDGIEVEEDFRSQFTSTSFKVKRIRSASHLPTIKKQQIQTSFLRYFLTRKEA